MSRDRSTMVLVVALSLVRSDEEPFDRDDAAIEH
jgi:hypothetical protein